MFALAISPDFIRMVIYKKNVEALTTLIEKGIENAHAQCTNCGKDNH